MSNPIIDTISLEIEDPGVAPVPVPPSALLLGSGLLALVSLVRRRGSRPI